MATKEPFSRWLLAARVIADAIARANAEGYDLTRLYLYLDPDVSAAEVTNARDVHAAPLFFGTLAELDERNLLTIDDAKSNYVLQMIAEIIEDFIEDEGYYDEEDWDDEND